MESNKEQAKDIYAKHWAKWVNETFGGDPVKPSDLKDEDEHLWIIEAMEEYKAITPATNNRQEIMKVLIPNFSKTPNGVLQDIADEILAAITPIKDVSKFKYEDITHWQPLPSPPKQNSMNKEIKSGIELITEKRQDQIKKHNYDLERDVKLYPNGELIRAACAISYVSPDGMPAKIAAP